MKTRNSEVANSPIAIGTIAMGLCVVLALSGCTSFWHSKSTPPTTGPVSAISFTLSELDQGRIISVPIGAEILVSVSGLGIEVSSSDSSILTTVKAPKGRGSVQAFRATGIGRATLMGPDTKCKVPECSAPTSWSVTISVTSSPLKSVAFQGVAFEVPEGWTVIAPRTLPCGGFEDRTVVLGSPVQVADCKYDPNQPMAEKQELWVDSMPEGTAGATPDPTKGHSATVGALNGWYPNDANGSSGPTALTIDIPDKGVEFFFSGVDNDTQRQILDSVHAAPLP